MTCMVFVPLQRQCMLTTTYLLRMQAEAAQYVSSQSTVVQQWSAVTKFKGKSGEVLLVPDHQVSRLQQQ